MDRFWKLLEKSTIVSGLIACSIVGAVIERTVTGQPIPDILGQALLVVLAGFIGTKVGELSIQDQVRRELEDLRKRVNSGRN